MAVQPTTWDTRSSLHDGVDDDPLLVMVDERRRKLKRGSTGQTASVSSGRHGDCRQRRGGQGGVNESEGVGEGEGNGEGEGDGEGEREEAERLGRSDMMEAEGAGAGEWMEGIELGGLEGEEELNGLLARGNRLMQQDNFEEAIQCYSQALQQLRRISPFLPHLLPLALPTLPHARTLTQSTGARVDADADAGGGGGGGVQAAGGLSITVASGSASSSLSHLSACQSTREKEGSGASGIHVDLESASQPPEGGSPSLPASGPPPPPLLPPHSIVNEVPSVLLSNRCAAFSSLSRRLRSIPASLSERHALFGLDPVVLAQLALKDAHRLVALSPAWPKAHLRHGQALALAEKFPEAREALLAGLELDPSNPLLGAALRAIMDDSDGDGDSDSDREGRGGERAGNRSGSGEGQGEGGKQRGTAVDGDEPPPAVAPGARSGTSEGGVRKEEQCLGVQEGEGGEEMGDEPQTDVSNTGGNNVESSRSRSERRSGSGSGRGSDSKRWRQTLHSDELECSLCLKLLYCPVTTPCGHTFCRTCLARTLDHANKCPICRTVLFVNPMSYPVTLVLHHVLEKHFPEEYDERKRECEEERGLGREVLPLFVMDVVLPGKQLALNIFEPRYRLMIRRIMEGDHRMGMVGCDRRSGEVLDVACEVKITECEPLPDGRYHIEVEAQRRCHIVRSWEQDGYRVAQVKWLSDNLPADGTADADELLSLARQLSDSARTWVNRVVAAARPQQRSRLPEHFANIPPPPSLRGYRFGWPMSSPRPTTSEWHSCDPRIARSAFAPNFSSCKASRPLRATCSRATVSYWRFTLPCTGHAVRGPLLQCANVSKKDL